MAGDTWSYSGKLRIQGLKNKGFTLKNTIIIRSLIATTIMICYILAYFQPIWNFRFVAPQYPQGLELEILLSGARGDTFEIDIINHYIGMSKLGDAAELEKMIAPYIIIVLSLLAFIVAFIPLKKIYLYILSLPILGFPVAFVVIFYSWLYKFGHDLDPTAPIELAPFTPTILGTGIIGQFRTFAFPNTGFLLTLFAAILTAILLRMRKKEISL